MKILVTGGAGFIGSHIVDALLVRGHEVKVLDLQRPQQDVSWAECDLVGPTARAAIYTYFPDVICHQAAQPSLRKSIEHPVGDALVNIIGTLNVIEAARGLGAHVVFASTSAVYDPTGGKFTEDSPIKPNLPYGIAKASAELYLRNSGVSHTILRYGNVYGPRQVAVGENQLIPHALAHIFNDAPFAVNGDGEQSRDFVYVKDIAYANVLALEGRVQGTFNCGTGAAHTVNDVCRSLGLLDPPYAPAKSGEARSVVLNSSRAWSGLSWRAEVSLREGLALTYAAWREAWKEAKR